MLNTVDDYIKHNLVHTLHTTTMRSYRGCRRRWSWVFRDYYYPTMTPMPLEFGVAFHYAMEYLYDPLTWHDKEVALQLAKVALMEKIDEQVDNFRKHHGELDPEQEADYKSRRKLGLDMLQYYYDKVLPKYDHGFKPIKVEVKFEVPIKDPDGKELWCKCNDCWRRYWNHNVGKQAFNTWQQTLNGFVPLSERVGEFRGPWRGLPVTFGGRIDMLAEDENGEYWIFDWKTAQRIASGEDHQSDDSFLLLEDQITSYCWALHVLGIDVAGFVYAEIKKAVPTEPEPLKRAYKGRLYSANKQDAYDADLYEQTVQEGDPNGYHNGLYDEFIEYLRTEGSTTFHLRHQVHRNSDELRSAGYNIWLQAKEMTSPDLPIYPSPGRFACKGCAFQEPCLGTNRGEDVQYYLDSMYEKRNKHYYEDAPPSTDKRRES